MQLLLIFILGCSLPVLAHQSSLTSTKKEVRWSQTTIPVKIVNNSTSFPGSNSVILQSIGEWNAVSATKLQPVSSGTNQIRFENDFSLYGSAVVGVTEVNYGTSGTINSATVRLNEQHYDFTGTPGMPIGSTVYLGDVVTHELGHFLGLGHTEVLNATMFYASFTGQSALAEDDKAGIRSKYNSGHGKIHGYVKGGKHVGILGVHVQAISRKTGEAIASISGADGYFEIMGLDVNDTYYLYTSTLKNPDALSGYYATTQNDFCPGSYIGSFYSACGKENDGLPYGINLTTAVKSFDAGEVSVNCSLRASEDYQLEKLKDEFSQSLPIWNYAEEEKFEKSYVGFFNNNQLSALTFSAPDKFQVDLRNFVNANGQVKKIKIQIISQVLGNPVEYVMRVKRNGMEIPGSPFLKGRNAEYIYELDLKSGLTLSSVTANNIFEIEVSGKKLSEYDGRFIMPSFYRFASTQDFPYLLVVSLSENGGELMDTQQYLSDNSSCLDAPFTFEVSGSTANADEKMASKTNSAAAAAACGTIDPPSGPQSGGGPFFGIMALGFMLITLGSRFVKRGKYFLS